ncbi:uncharacterized protein UV8b_02344 [Ustilaginoidea virens]|uniref:Uncharacterized protein n=1 Tax=Ustilaginoidea virens TaxID=1159556 RepID=A0A063BXY6_USTVR|nr:uncharacterized protein UV8b_02344 [Ustilaginoidea virens]QUC18103.1 hypothetical protein UV8b_02344 [Ustilaginoidea virens]GAO15058.1 hypothetical protein UVI_02048790 [Ustilaginoidea virens]
MSGQLGLAFEQQEELQDILEAMQEARLLGGSDWWHDFPELELIVQQPITPHMTPSPRLNVLDEIPRHDSTYRHLSASMVPHTLFPEMYLLEYQTFSGAMAFQPCSRNIDLVRFFEALEPIEKGGDSLFKVARTWSCIIQSLEGLPKDVRWVLATIYNFANEMMRPHVTEDALWSMRPWLMYWYDVADRLFAKYDIPATAPDPDWFLRPEVVTTQDAMGLQSGSDMTCHRTDSLSSDSNQTVRHHVPRHRANVQKYANQAQACEISSAVTAWVASQPDWAAVYHGEFDPAPGGRARTRTAFDPSPPPNSYSDELSQGLSGRFRLNPEAAEFDPQTDLTTSPASVSSRAPSQGSIVWDRGIPRGFSDVASNDSWVYGDF